MVFYLLSEGLACASVCSGAYESLKALANTDAGVDKARLSTILEFWLVLAAMTIVEEYVEFLVSWFPFYYLFKCSVLGFMLMPQSKLPHVLCESFLEPATTRIKQEVDARVVPIFEEFVVKHGHWFNKQLLTRSLQLFDDDELANLERDLQAKLAEVREEQRARHRGAEKAD